MTEKHSEEQLIEPDTERLTTEIGGKALLGVGRLAEVIGVDEARAWFDQRQARIDFLHERSLRHHGPIDPTARFK
jgi:hypothetical protein